MASGMVAGREQRRDPRQHLLLRVDAPDQHADHQPAFGWTADISAGGVAVRGLPSLRQGQILRLRLSFPGLLDPVDVLGDVVWATRDADSVRDAGCGVRVWSTLDRQRLQTLADITSVKPVPRVSPYRVLVVEADATAALTYRLALENLSPVARAQLGVELARNWDAAYEAIERQRIDMLVIGLSAAHQDGALVLDYARHNQDLKDTAVVALSNGDDPDVEVVARSVADAVLSKPVDLGQVLETVAFLLHRRSTKHARVSYV